MSTVTLHKGKLANTASHEEMIDFILYNRALGNTVTCNEIIYISEVKTKDIKNSWSTLQKWWYRFMHRHFLVFRRNNHYA